MIERHVLSNGVRIVLEPMPHAVSAALGIWCERGSRHEPEALAGISHFLEHMVFKGTRTRDAFTIARSLEDRGGSLNAFTDKEHVCFYARVLGEDLGLALEVVSDLIVEPLFDAREVVRERRVVLEEARMVDDDPEELVQDLFHALSWPEHPLGRPVIGTRGAIRRFRREDCLAWAREAFDPTRIVVSVAGKVDVPRFLLDVERILGGLTSSGTEPDRYLSDVRPGTRLRRKELEQVQVCLGVPGLPAGHPDRHALTVLDTVLGAGMSSRLFQEVREKRGLVYHIGTFEVSYADAGLFGAYFGCTPRHLDEVFERTFHEFDRLRAGDLPEAEFQRCRDQLRGGLLLGLESVRNRMMRLARYEMLFRRIVTPEETLSELEAVSRDDVLRLASEHFQPGRLILAAVGPSRKLRLPAGWAA
ncbi:MAG: pitrilysin family protein [bacterium]|nr:pitrilysin family protein [bacterium]